MPVRTMTLAAGVAETIQLGHQSNEIAVYNIGVTPDDVTVGLDDTDAVPDADDTWRVPPGSRREITWSKTTGTQINVYSPGAAMIEVEWL